MIAMKKILLSLLLLSVLSLLPGTQTTFAAGTPTPSTYPSPYPAGYYWVKFTGKNPIINFHDRVFWISATDLLGLHTTPTDNTWTTYINLSNDPTHKVMDSFWNINDCNNNGTNSTDCVNSLLYIPVPFYLYLVTCTISGCSGWTYMTDYGGGYSQDGGIQHLLVTQSGGNRIHAWEDSKSDWGYEDIIYNFNCARSNCGACFACGGCTGELSPQVSPIGDRAFFLPFAQWNFFTGKGQIPFGPAPTVAPFISLSPNQNAFAQWAPGYRFN